VEERSSGSVLTLKDYRGLEGFSLKIEYHPLHVLRLQRMHALESELAPFQSYRISGGP
jgi:hypothetical protein